MKSRLGVLLLLVTAACGFYALTVLAAQDVPTPPTAPTPPAVPTPPSAVPVPPAPPLLPSVPFYAAAPAAPPAPAMPAMPAVPAIPAEPGWPDWNGRHSMSISDGHHQPAEDCSDLHVRFDDRDAVMETEERTVTKAEAYSSRSPAQERRRSGARLG
jgi:hypothetical protein